MTQENPSSSYESVAIRGYLDRPGARYLNAINGVTVESLVKRTSEIARLKRHLPDPQVLASVGVGQGEEIHALDYLYEGKAQQIIGVDMSYVALGAAWERAKQYHLPASFMIGNVTELSLLTESVDGIVLSSLMHEVYSYASDGKEAWNKTVQEAARVLREGGCILLRDSAAPEIDHDVEVYLKTPLAQEFYDYFTEEYRAFNGWEDLLKDRLRSNLPPFPDRREYIPVVASPEYSTAVSYRRSNVVLSSGQAAELLFHFVNFEMGYPNDPNFIGNKMWKELNETYYIPRENHSSRPMRTAEYVAEVLEHGNLALIDTPYRLVCVEQEQSVRPRMPEPISKHFFLGSPEQHDHLVAQFVNKMELVFKKLRK